MAERVYTYGGSKATRPLSDFALQSIGIGNVYYVDSENGDDGRVGTSPEASLATLDTAIGKCSANQGDMIVVLPGHSESEASDASIATLDVDGVTVVGLGVGDDMPTFNLGHADATFTISGADCRVSGLKFVSTIADVAVGVTMTAASDNSIVENCVFRDSADDEEMLVGISVAGAAHGVKLIGNDFKTTLAAGSDNAILADAVTDLEVRDNVAYGKYATGAMLTSDVLTRATIVDNIFVNAEAAIGIALNGSTSTGILARNFLGGTTSIAAALTGEDAMWCFENYITGAEAASGILDPGADAD